MGRGFDLSHIIENRVSYISISLTAGTFLLLVPSSSRSPLARPGLHLWEV